MKNNRMRCGLWHSCKWLGCPHHDYHEEKPSCALTCSYTGKVSTGCCTVGIRWGKGRDKAKKVGD